MFTMHDTINFLKPHGKRKSFTLLDAKSMATADGGPFSQGETIG